MNRYRLFPSAELRIDEIYDYSFERWGPAQADAYTRGLYECCDDIATGKVISRKIPATFGIYGFYANYRQHFIYWRKLPDGVIGIVSVLHQSMHQQAHLLNDLR